MAKKKVDIQYIIDQSILLFREKSYYNTSMSDIAKACGILKGSLYHYFRSKEELMIKVIGEVHKYFKEHIFIFAYQKDITPAEKMNNLCNAIEKVFYNKKTGELYGNIGIESAILIEPFQPLIRDFFDDFNTAFYTIYRKKYSTKESKQLSRTSIAEIEGSILLARLYHEPNYIIDVCNKLKSSMYN